MPGRGAAYLPPQPNHRLIDAIALSGRTIADVCRAVGVSRSRFYRVERGVVGARVGWYERFAAELGAKVTSVAPASYLERTRRAA